MEKLKAITDRLAAASTELSATSDEAARGSNKQKEQAEQAATAMEQMSATVVEVAENSNRAAEAARTTAAEARAGSQVVNEAVGAMNMISQRVQDQRLRAVCKTGRHRTGTLLASLEAEGVRALPMSFDQCRVRQGVSEL